MRLGLEAVNRLLPRLLEPGEVRGQQGRRQETGDRGQGTGDRGEQLIHVLPKPGVTDPVAARIRVARYGDYLYRELQFGLKLIF